MMRFVVDESSVFKFDSIPPMKWRIATVCGAILPYEGRKIWLKSHKAIRKGSDYSTEESICDVLDVLIKCRVRGILRIGDTGHISLEEANIFRQNWINPHYDYADSQSKNIRESLRLHLDNLMGIGEYKFSNQEFFKVVNILDTIASFIQWLTQNLSNLRAIDLRKIRLIIDDQSKASLITLRSFIHYFLWRRSHQGLFNCPPNSLHRLRGFIRKEGDKVFLDTTKLFDEFIVEENANQDDKYPELKIADLLSNFSRRVLNGDFDIKVAQRLEKILVAVNQVCFDNHEDIVVKLPTQNQAAINLLLAKKTF